MKRLTLAEEYVDSKWMTMMLMLLLMLSAIVNGWQVDTENGILDAGDNCRTPTGGAGVCTRISTCEPYVKKMVQYSALRRCSFIGNEEVTCCPQTATPTTTGTTGGWGRSVNPTTTTTTTTTTTMRPVIIRDVTITGKEEFFDLSKVLRLSTTTTTRRPQIHELQPVLPANIQRPLQRTFNWATVNPIAPGGSNNIQWPNQQVNVQPSNPQHAVRFLTTTSTHRPFNPDVEVFNPNVQGPTSEQLVQLPSTNSHVTNPIAVITNPFEQYEFRPSHDDAIEDEVSTVRPVVDNGLGDEVWAWSDTATTPRPTTRTTTTTPSPQSFITEDWIQAALRNATGFRLPVPTTTTAPLIDVVPFSVTPATGTDQTVTTRNQNERPSQAACRRWRAFNPASLTFHILDGIPVAPGDYPHMGGLVFPVGGGDDIDVRCGTSLIAEQYALTAAHCVNDPVALPTMVRFGVVVWNSTVDDILPVDVEIENITLHDEYRAPLRYHDIAIIKLRRTVDFTPYIRPACLYSDMGDVDTAIPLVVIGWGVTNVQTRSRSEVLLMTNVTTVPLAECNATHVAQGVQRTYRNGLNEGHYCAFDPQLLKDACQADSGGPLQLVQNKESTIVGIVSFGLSCGSVVPSVYARVAFYLGWIESIVWPS